MRRSKALIFIAVLSICVPISVFGQLVPGADPIGTIITEIDPTFTCGDPFENVPIARDSGKVWQFENPSWPAFTYFGIEKVTGDVIDGNDGTFPTCDALVTATYDVASSDLAGGIVKLTATTSYPVLGSTPARLVYVVTNSANSPVALTDSLGIILFDVTSVGNFNVRVLLEAWVGNVTVSQNFDCYPGAGNLPNNRWYPAVELFDRLENDPNTVICTSYDRDTSMVFYAPECASIVSVSDSIIVEGSGGGGTSFSFSVSITSDCANPTSVDWTVVHGTTDASDFTGSVSGTLTMAGDTTSKLISFDVAKDDLVELDETFTIQLSSPSALAVIGDGEGAGIISNDDTSRITVASPIVFEGAAGNNANMVFGMSLSKQVDVPISVDFSTSDSTAVGGEDYLSQTNTFTFIAANTSLGLAQVVVFGDCRNEVDEILIATLTNIVSSGRAVIFEDPTGLGTIFNDDPVDVIDPVASCRDTTLQLGPAGMISLNTGMIDNGSSDDCYVDSIYASKYLFSCLDLGVQIVTLYVVDEGGNIDSCTAQVTIIDTLDRCWPSSIAYVDSAASGTESGVNWANAFPNLDSALSAALLYNNIAQIWVAKGTYYPTNSLDRDAAFELIDNIEVHGGFANGNTSLNQQNLALNPTILSGDIGISGNSSDNSFHIVNIENSIESALLSFFIISDGNATAGATPGPVGGGVFSNGELHLKNVLITNCLSEGEGAAIFISGASARLILTDCTIENNTSLGEEDIVSVLGARITVSGSMSSARD